MKRPPGLVGSLALLGDGGKLHIANPERLDWRHGKVTTYCGREWPLPRHTHTWAEADAAEICKVCLRSSSVAEFVAHERHQHFWQRFLSH
jgi:hypothetical protein